MVVCGISMLLTGQFFAEIGYFKQKLKIIIIIITTVHSRYLDFGYLE